MFPPSRCTKIFKITLNTTTLGRVRTFDIQSSLGNVLLGELSRLSAKKVLLTFCELSCIIEISRVISMLTNMLPGGTNWPFKFRIKNFHFVCIWKVTLDALSSTLLVVYLQIFSPLVYVLYLCICVYLCVVVRWKESASNLTLAMSAAWGGAFSDSTASNAPTPCLHCAICRKYTKHKKCIRSVTHNYANANNPGLWSATTAKNASYKQCGSMVTWGMIVWCEQSTWLDDLLA